jgi:hypothetical protein
MDKYTNLLEQLKEGKVQQIEIQKDEFLAFRSILVGHKNFKNFRGEAKQGGNIVYTYLSEPRS